MVKYKTYVKEKQFFQGGTQKVNLSNKTKGDK